MCWGWIIYFIYLSIGILYIGTATEWQPEGGWRSNFPLEHKIMSLIVWHMPIIGLLIILADVRPTSHREFWNLSHLSRFFPKE